MGRRLPVHLLIDLIERSPSNPRSHPVQPLSRPSPLARARRDAKKKTPKQSASDR